MSSQAQAWTIASQRGQKQNRIPPFAPSLNEQQYYLSQIKAVAGNPVLPKKALVLGATPELRDMAIDCGMESMAVDISREMMDKFSKLMRNQAHHLDTQAIDDWLDMVFPENSFGIIMGDASLNNLATQQDNKRLINICHKVLATNGLLVLRQVTYPSAYKGYEDFKSLVSDYRGGKIPWEDFFMEMRIHVLKPMVYNPETYQSDSKRTFEMIESFYLAGLLTAEEYERINTFRNNVINTFYPEDKFIGMAGSQGFRLEYIFKDQPCLFFQYLSMFTFRKI